MIDRNLARGLFLAAIALAFGLGALRYPIGDFARAGAGLFPLMVSVLLLLIALATLVRSRVVTGPRFEFNPVNIALLLSALCAFALVSRVLNMTAGIVAMVFISGFAGTAKYSIVRNLKVSVGLFLVALVFQKLLGLSLNLY
ncbi:tripartite tricarboxylate transporter TctB family protein [Rhizobacter sp. OV335]|uniref:tripartite tricarboxylate transporter TctB family protein n=1 Tax=Rhizobacter sp. OV335 TaxID=1500264 RepID=UPI00091D5B2C|nr:tripartite tricarboxylate transporter TctB family protein [Rhizobacter sp. OV335]SHN09178.1 Tripartite tricarboxylate transporter TctB family protein [Rhizobacter sp. OV335]